jgi:hypothetical protein
MSLNTAVMALRCWLKSERAAQSTVLTVTAPIDIRTSSSSGIGLSTSLSSRESGDPYLEWMIAFIAGLLSRPILLPLPHLRLDNAPHPTATLSLPVACPLLGYRRSEVVGPLPSPTKTRCTSGALPFKYMQQHARRAATSSHSGHASNYEILQPFNQ